MEKTLVQVWGKDQEDSLGHLKSVSSTRHPNGNAEHTIERMDLEPRIVVQVTVIRSAGLDI